MLLRPSLTWNSLMAHQTTRTFRQSADLASIKSSNAAIPIAAGPALAKARRYEQLSLLPFQCLDCDTGELFGGAGTSHLDWPDPGFTQLLSTNQTPKVRQLKSGLICYSLPVPSFDERSIVAFGYVLAHPAARPEELIMAAAERDWCEEQVSSYLNDLPSIPLPQLKAMLQLLNSQVNDDHLATRLTEEMDQLGEQLEQTYEEISLLHSLTRNLQISRSPVNLAELCLDRMRELVHCEGNAIWLEGLDEESGVLVQGRLPFGVTDFSRLIDRCGTHDWPRPLVRNQIQNSLLGSEFPGLKSLIVVPITEGAHRSGWLISCNVADGLEFGTVEASLLNSIATILGTHVRNIDLYQQQEELIVSVVRSMVSTLDAKDPYTRGHSERVARIARRLGEQMKLPKEDLDDIYLSGLVHDIGKIGIDDRILRKPGRLTDEEFEQIKLHPSIGYDILKGIRNLQQVLPGVRHHHEQFGGFGYPDCLKGEDIPLMARIMAVADAYDAMTSNRPYRQGMPVERVEAIFHSGRGSQWDPDVIDAYFEVCNEISQICDGYRPEVLLDSERSRLIDAEPDHD